MNWRAWWSRFNQRERRLIAIAGTVLVLALVRFVIISPFLAYRERLRDEIALHHEKLDNARAYLARATEVDGQHKLLRARMQEIRTQLIPGDKEKESLAAAALQDTLHKLASDKGVTIQSTQVMPRDETLSGFRRIAVRMTVTSTVAEMAGFLAGIEYGPQRLAIPFLEISKRGAVLRGQTGRALAGTLEVTAFLQGTDGAGAGNGGAPGDRPSPAGPLATGGEPTPGGEAAGAPSPEDGNVPTPAAAGSSAEAASPAAAVTPGGAPAVASPQPGATA
jgi:hypothetical protein